MVMVMVMDDHLILLSHFLGWHLCVVLFLRKGWDSEAKRNGGRQGNNKLVHGFPPGSSKQRDKPFTAEELNIGSI
jgi:hypothetical protein